ncbi:MAG: VOC family protein [Acidimicrobiales bacterium]
MEVLTSRTIVHPADLDRSLEFYGGALGLAVARQFGHGEGRGVVFFAGGGLIEVVAGPSASPSASPSAGPSASPSASPTAAGRTGRAASAVPPVALWLQVRSVETTLAELEGRGVPVVRPARLEPWGLVEAWIDDPDGLRIHLVEVPADHPLRRDPRGPAEGAAR